MLTSLKPNVDPKGRYNVKQTAAALGIHPNTVRIYTVRGLLRADIHKATGRPLYQGAEILKFWNTVL